MWTKLLEKISSLLYDDSCDKTWSTMRFLVLFIVIISNLAFWGIWAYLSVKGGAIIEIPERVLYVYVGINITGVMGKAFQKTVEKSEEKNNGTN